MTTESNSCVDSIPAHVHEAIDRAGRYIDQRLWGQACDVLIDVVQALDQLGIDSAYARWLSGVASDSAGRLAEAVVHIVRARALDPVSVPAIKSENIILDRVIGLLDVVGTDDVYARSVVGIVRRHYAADHPAVLRIDEKLTEEAARVLGDNVSRRALA